MKEKTVAKRTYEYKIGYFSQLFGGLVAVLSGIAGVVAIVKTLEAGAYDKIAEVIIFSISCLIAAIALMRWLQRDSLSSKLVAFHDDKVQLPMSLGDSDDDYLLFADVLGLKVDRDYHDHGAALIVSTSTKTVAYKSMYFDSQGEFDDFCSRFERVLMTQG